MSDFSSSANILRAVTRDPQYASRVAGANDALRMSGGKSWDSRVTRPGIPTYDALNDRYCKFALRKRLNRPPSNAGLAPLARNTRAGTAAWAARAATPDVGGGPASLPRALTPQPGVPQVGMQGPRFPQPAQAFVETPAVSAHVPDTASPELLQGANVEVAVAKTKSRLLKLMDELGTPQHERGMLDEPTDDDEKPAFLAHLTNELQRLTEERNVALQVEKAIEVREGFLYLMQELTERYATTTMDKERGLRELNALVSPFRNSSLDVVESVQLWRERQRGQRVPYLWKGVSYLHKMSTDLFFLAHSRLRLLLDFDVVENPLLDPRRQRSEGRLPPLQRGKEQVLPKDFPRDRVDVALRILSEEAERQRQLLATEVVADASMEEFQHLKGYVSPSNEQQQIVHEERSWLREQVSDTVDHDAAAVKIQSGYRAMIARREVQRKLQERKAAVKIQCLARRFLAHLRADELRRHDTAAKRIQSLQRGIATRKHIQAARRIETAATDIQRVYKGYTARRVTTMLQLLHVSARHVQRLFRGFRIRKALALYHDAHEGSAAVMVQKHWRGFLVRSNPAYSPKKIRDATTIQAWFRGCLARSRARAALHVTRGAVRIQAFWRGTAGRAIAAQLRARQLDFQWQAQYTVLRENAVKIQSVWRMALVRRAVVAEKLRRRAIEEESARRALEEAHRTAEQQLATLTACVLRLQGVGRGFSERCVLGMGRLLSLTAVQIQRTVRGFLGRCRAKERAQQNLLKAANDAHPPVVSPVVAAAAALRESQSPARGGDVAQRLDMESSMSTDHPTSAPLESAAPVGEEFVEEHQPRAVPEAPPTPPETSVCAESTSEPEPEAEPTCAVVSNDAVTAVEPVMLTRSSVEEEVHPSSDVASHHHTAEQAALVVTRFFRTATADQVVKRQGRSRKHRDGDARVQEMEYAAVMLQAWAQTEHRRRVAADLIALRQQRQAVYVATLNSALHERTFAALVIQRSFWPVVHARAVLGKKRHAAGVARSGRGFNATMQEQSYAARLAGRLVKFHRRLTQQRRRPSRDPGASMHQERLVAVRMIQRAARRYIAGRVVCPDTVRASVDQERETAATMIVLWFSSVTGCSRRVQHKNLQALSNETVAITQERDAAARAIQVHMRRFHVRQTTARTAKAHRVHILEQQERAYAVTLIAAYQRHRVAVSLVAALSQQRRVAAEHERQQEVVFAVSSIQSCGRGFVARQGLPLLKAPPVAVELPTVEPPSEAPAKTGLLQDRPFATPDASLGASTASAASAPGPRHVQFAVTTQRKSRILPEPPLNPETDAEARHDQSHLREGVSPRRSPMDEDELLNTMGEVTLADTGHVSFRMPLSEALASSAPVPEPEAVSSRSVSPNPPSRDGDTPLTADIPEQDAEQDGDEPRFVAPEQRGEAACDERVCDDAPPPEEAADVPEENDAADVTDTIVETADTTVCNSVTTQHRDSAAQRLQCAERQRQARAELASRRAAKAATQRAAHTSELIAAKARADAIQAAEVERSVAATDARRYRAAVVLQCAYRCYNARFKLRWMQERRAHHRAVAAHQEHDRTTSKAATTIQRPWRAKMARSELQRRKTAQRERDSLARAKIVRETNAATRIQCAYRSYNARFETEWRRQDVLNRKRRADSERAAADARVSKAKGDAEAQSGMALAIQCAWRCYNARFAARMLRERKVERDAALRTERAVMLLQRMGRGAVRRGTLRVMSAQSRNYAALLAVASASGAPAEKAVAEVRSVGIADPALDDEL